MKILLTIAVDHLEIDKKDLTGFQIFNFGELYLKYDISITNKKKYNNRQKYLSKEISLINENVIIIGNPCYDRNDLTNLIEELKKYDLSLTSVYIPSDESIELRKQKAIDDQRKWGYRDGISEDEIARNFVAFKSTLQELIKGLSESNIKVIEI